MRDIFGYQNSRARSLLISHILHLLDLINYFTAKF